MRKEVNGMAVFRIEKTRDYTVMSNHHLRNTALSLKAKGLFTPYGFCCMSSSNARCLPFVKYIPAVPPFLRA